MRQCHNNALMQDITMISGKTLSANAYGCASKRLPNRKDVPSAVADDSFATPALTAAKNPATYSLKSRKPKPIITAIAVKIFFIFISLMLLDSGTTTATRKITPKRTCK